jgi:hypothetical protein
MSAHHRYPWRKYPGVLILSGLVGLAMLPRASISSDSRSARDPASPTSCFNRRNWTRAWRVTPDARTMYINVAGAVYRLDLDQAYTLLKSPWAILHDSDSSDVICTAIDFRLSVTDRIGNWQVPIVKKMTRLTPEEAAALPKSLRP